MEHTEFALAIVNQAANEQRTVNEILACNQSTKQYGLSLNETQALALVQTRSNVLRETKRIEFGTGIIDKLVLAFEDSPHVTQDTFEEILHDVIGLFYELKNNTQDQIPDAKLIAFLKKGFDDSCHGSIELLSGEVMRLAEHIHRGEAMEDFKMREN